MSPTAVNVFVVGAPKAGTTSLHKHLLSFPEIDILSVKEPHSFGE